MDLSGLLYILILLLVLAFFFVRYMSANHDYFKKIGVGTLPTNAILGHVGTVMKLGVFNIQLLNHKTFKDKKVYGWYQARKPILFVKDLDMIKDILVKDFNSFANRQALVLTDAPLRSCLLGLKDNQWKHVRNIVSPTFSSGKVKKMSPHIEKNASRLIDCLREKQERNEEVELKDIFSLFTMDVIASTGFGMETNSLKDPNNDFSVNAKKIFQGNVWFMSLAMIFPGMAKVLSNYLGFQFFDKKAIQFFIKMVDAAIENRKEEGQAGKVNDFVDLVINAEQESGGSSQTLTREEIYGQALIFIFAGYDTVSSVLSLTMFLLALHPDICKKAQEEIDGKLGKSSPGFDNVQNLTYLEMCINEAMRLYPVAFLLDRECSQDVEIEGIPIPKGMPVFIPVYAIHHDQDLWPEPEKFDPERFSPENKVHHHPYAFLPFGYGPRNCIGMRLGQLEVRVALASVLQKFTPITCDKTVYPVRLEKLRLAVEDGLWVKMESRKH